MDMQFLKIESSLNTCKTHLDPLDKSNAITAELEAVMVASLVLLIVSEYEVLIENMFAERVMRCGDIHVAQYIKVNIARRFRSPDLNKITETLGQFGQD